MAQVLRPDPKKRAAMDHRKRQFQAPQFPSISYPNRLNFYTVPPTDDITLEQFEEWAIQRLKVLAEIEACTFRNKTPEETVDYMRPILDKFLPLAQNSSNSSTLQDERRKDHYSHFILRLAFAATEDLRARFARLETQLFQLRLSSNDVKDRQDFINGLNFEWERVSEEERASLKSELEAVFKPWKTEEDRGWFKLAWERVPDLVGKRAVLLRRGVAYVPAKEQTSMILTEFTRRLDSALVTTSRALPKLDEDGRLAPILSHLSQNFSSTSSYSEENETLPGATISAASVDNLSQHFPLCMRNLHSTLRKNHHLKHFGRLQYTLFLKGIGLSLEDCLLFWRSSFKNHTDDQFNKEYRYNIRHAYGDVGGDSNRRGRGYTPYSCQKLLTEAVPGPGQTHGCPYRTHTPDNLTALLQGMGVSDSATLRGVHEDVGKQRYHIACNRVFEWAHKGEIKQVKDEGTWRGEDLDTIVHPNVYFKRSWLLKNLGKGSEEPKRAIAIDR